MEAISLKDCLEYVTNEQSDQVGALIRGFIEKEETISSALRKVEQMLYPLLEKHDFTDIRINARITASVLQKLIIAAREAAILEATPENMERLPEILDLLEREYSGLLDEDQRKELSKRTETIRNLLNNGRSK